jgi:hypothetical protein
MRRPVECVYVCHFKYVSDAIAWEKQLKKWGRKKKEIVIKGEFEVLHGLSVCLNGSHHKAYNVIMCHAERSRSALNKFIPLNDPSTTLGMTK